MKQEDQFRFVSLLALELDNGDISLPSLPDVVMKIRKLLSSEDCDFERISQAVSVDPVLVSRLFVFANSAFYNRANVKVESLDGAIGRLGFEVVRSAAMSLAMKQLYGSDKHSKSAKQQKAVWARGMKLSCMAFAVASLDDTLNQESAFLCGLLHEVGSLYILTKAGEFPGLLAEAESLHGLMAEWNPQISKSIVESWGFATEIIESTDPASYVDHDTDTPANLIDVMIVAQLMLGDTEENLQSLFDSDLSCQKLGMSNDAAAQVMTAYRDKLKTMQQSLN